jgi:hypothetical protein
LLKGTVNQLRGCLGPRAEQKHTKSETSAVY